MNEFQEADMMVQNNFQFGSDSFSCKDIIAPDDESVMHGIRPNSLHPTDNLREYQAVVTELFSRAKCRAASIHFIREVASWLCLVVFTALQTLCILAILFFSLYSYDPPEAARRLAFAGLPFAAAPLSLQLYLIVRSSKRHELDTNTIARLFIDHFCMAVVWFMGQILSSTLMISGASVNFSAWGSTVMGVFQVIYVTSAHLLIGSAVLTAGYAARRSHSKLLASSQDTPNLV